MGTDMEEIKKLYAKPREFLIPKEKVEGKEQARITIIPLGLDDIASLDIDENASMSEIAKSSNKLFAASLGITEEESGKLSIEFMQDILEAIMDANNFKEADLEKTGVKKFLKEKRALIKKKEGEDVKGSVKEA